MFNPRLYREACRELRAPEDKIEEIISMTEKTNKKKIRPLRTALICAAAVAMMVVSVAAANPEGAREIWGHVLKIAQIGQYRHQVTDINGESWTLMSLPQTEVENRDGRTVLVINGKDAVDITDALDTEGSYTYKGSDEGAMLVITVNGRVDDWTMTTTLSYPALGDPGMTSVVSSSDPNRKTMILGEDGEVEVTGECYVAKDGGSAMVDGEITTGVYTTGHEVPQT